MSPKKKDKKHAPIKALRIDAITEAIKEVTLKKSGYFKEIFPLLSLAGQRPCGDINTVRIDNGHYLYVDGEGLLKDPEHFFWWKGFHHPLCSHAVIIRVDDEGESCSHQLDVDWVRAQIKFVKMKMHGFVQVQREGVIFGRKGLSVENTAVLTERGSTRSTDEARRAIAEHVGLPVEALRWVSLDEVEAMEEGIGEEKH